MVAHRMLRNLPITAGLLTTDERARDLTDLIDEFNQEVDVDRTEWTMDVVRHGERIKTHIEALISSLS